MTVNAMEEQAHLKQLRLFLEEICCELCRFRHVAEDSLAATEVRITREVDLGAPESFADIRVQVPGRAPYFVEINFGYTPEHLLEQISRKYSMESSLTGEVERLVLLIRSTDYPNWPEVETNLRSILRPDLELEIWDESDLLCLIRDHFGVEIGAITGNDLLAVREAIDKAKWRHAFGDDCAENPLADPLLWHFGPWTLHRLNDERRLQPHEVLRPGLYPGVVVLMADLCSFSSYVRDTRDDELIRHCLTAFYSKARYAVLNTGGMIFQFVGDEIVGLFGFPDHTATYTRDALDCARALIDIGNSVSNHWQRELDRVQKSGGVHIGLGIGDLNLVRLRPFFGGQVGFIGDALNVAARLMSEAGPSETVVSNSLYQRLDLDARQPFQELAPVEAKNIGLLQCWKLPCSVGGTAPPVRP